MSRPAFPPVPRTIRPAVLPDLGRPLPPVVAPELSQDEPDGVSMAVVREAHRMARAIIARAKAHARELEAEAHEQGLRTGKAEALETEVHALRQAAQALGAGAERLSALLVEAERELAETLPRLALSMARTILQTELTLKPEALASVVRTAVRAVLPARKVVVTLHPDDLAAWERAKVSLGDLLRETEIRLETRQGVERGYALVETEALTLDASVERQLEEAIRLLREAP